MTRDPSADDGTAGPVGPAARQVLAVAVVFAVLGGALVRAATLEPPPAALWTALSVVVVAAGAVLFGSEAIRAALGGLGR